MHSKVSGGLRGCNRRFFSMKKAIKTLTARAVFARNLRRARRIRDITQEVVAFDAGLTRAYVSSVERGVRNISIDNMALLADAVGVPLKDLVDPEQYKGPDDV
jgi:transcriptional regulator with XRE-family HTH domain